jgi:phosphate transport system protein
MADDRAINKKRFALEADCLTLIATQQPVATDMRILAAVLELAGELERVGDYAKGIANITLMIGEEPLIKPLIDIPRMADKAADMLHRALGAFINRDVELARSLPAEDDEVDALYNQVQRELMTYIMSKPTTFDQAMRLLWVAHNLERAADRVTNICERVVFTVTGKLEELNNPKG